MKPSTRLIKLLKTPSQLANSLDWGKQSKTVATLHIGKDNIGMAISSHPEYGEPSQPILPALKLELQAVDVPYCSSKGSHKKNDGSITCTTAATKQRKQLSPQTVRAIQDICDRHNVGSFVVVWPLQKEGRPGAACGKVLHTLESLIAVSNSVLTPHRPICLFHNLESDEHLKYREDEWGRCAVYARSTNKTYHKASIQQYRIPEGCSFAAVDAWDAFCYHHWPEIYNNYNDLSYAAASDDKVSKKQLASSANNHFEGGFSVTYSSQRVLSMHVM